MKSIYKIYCLFAIVAICGGCKKYLNVIPDNTGTLEYAFRNRNEAENYLFTCYASLQQLYDPSANAGFTTSGEIVYPNNLTKHPLDETGFNLLRGNQNSNNPGLNFWDGENHGQALYRSIRRCNILLENINQPADLTDFEKKRWIAEVKFLKAYYHYYLARMYGPIPLVKTNLDITASTEEVKVKRAPMDSVVNYIVQLLDEAAPDLPVTITNQAQELGRVTRAIDLSVKAEVLTMAASPLFNGNPDFTGLKNNDGVALFSAGYNAGKWQKAADACKAAILECESRGMRLYNFIAPASITQLPDSLRKVLSAQTAVTEKWDLNPELVWALNSNFPFQGFCTPRLTQQSVINIFRSAVYGRTILFRQGRSY
jgi:hypothetical protein